MLKRFFFQIHKILGLPLSIIFLVWFISGTVMIFTGSFPRAGREVPADKAPSLSSGLPSADSILRASRLEGGSLREVSSHLGRPIATIARRDTSVSLYLDDMTTVGAFEESQRDRIITQWCASPVERIDTLHDVDIWIPFERWRDEMPVYKYHFADNGRHQLYMTRDGRVIQFSDRSQRIRALWGSVPHWLYITCLRKHQTAWIETVKWAALLGCIMCLAGIIYSIMIMYAGRRHHGFFHNPFKKFWPRWHFITGLTFGLFAITFAFSGYMSLAPVPSWLLKDSGNTEMRQGRRSRGQHMSTDAPQLPPLDFREIIARHDSVKRIEFNDFNGHPFLTAVFPNSSARFDGMDSTRLRPMTLTEDMAAESLARIYLDSVSRQIETIHTYDDDYFGMDKKRTPLPVIRAIIDDKLHTRIYFNPETMTSRRVDDNSRLHTLLYTKLHKLQFKCLTDRPALWYAVMLFILAGGSFLSLTSVVLTFSWLMRVLRLRRR